MFGCAVAGSDSAGGAAFRGPAGSCARNDPVKVRKPAARIPLANTVHLVLVFIVALIRYRLSSRCRAPFYRCRIIPKRCHPPSTEQLHTTVIPNPAAFFADGGEGSAFPLLSPPSGRFSNLRIPIPHVISFSYGHRLDSQILPFAARCLRTSAVGRRPSFQNRWKDVRRRAARAWPSMVGLQMQR